MGIKKILFSTAFATLFLIYSNLPALAVDPTSKTINSYKFTTTKIEFSQDNGQTFTEIFSGSKETSFGSSTESSNQKKETICQNIVIPDGTYNYLRASRSSMGRISWQAAFPNGHTYYLHSDGFVWEDTPPASEADLTITDTFYDAGVSATEFTEGHKRTIYFKADLGSFTITANAVYTVFSLTVYESLTIGDLVASQTASDDETKTYTTTSTFTFPIKK